MTLVETLPAPAAGLAILACTLIALNAGQPRKGIWIIPALVSLSFLGWTLFTIITENSTGFWPEHQRNKWGNQIWFDLLIAVTIGWSLIVPRAKAVGMRLIPWLVFILFTASIGLSAMLARYLYLKERAA